MSIKVTKTMMVNAFKEIYRDVRNRKFSEFHFEKAFRRLSWTVRIDDLEFRFFKSHSGCYCYSLSVYENHHWVTYHTARLAAWFVVSYFPVIDMMEV